MTPFALIPFRCPRAWRTPVSHNQNSRCKTLPIPIRSFTIRAGSGRTLIFPILPTGIGERFSDVRQPEWGQGLGIREQAIGPRWLC